MYTLPDLPYKYDALEPVISKEIMTLHHRKHHQTYVDKLNLALKGQTSFDGKSLSELLREIDLLPELVRVQVRNHGGGHYNHSFFWDIMHPGGKEISNALRVKLSDKYGSFDAFVEQFNESAKNLFGSGWVWLTADLEIVVMPNQDNPIMIGLGEPILGLDVWEHAYYLDYKNKRDEYINEWWKIVNWEAVEARLNQ